MVRFRMASLLGLDTAGREARYHDRATVGVCYPYMQAAQRQRPRPGLLRRPLCIGDRCNGLRLRRLANASNASATRTTTVRPAVISIASEKPKRAISATINGVRMMPPETGAGERQTDGKAALLEKPQACNGGDRAKAHQHPAHRHHEIGGKQLPRRIDPGDDRDRRAEANRTANQDLPRAEPLDDVCNKDDETYAGQVV